MKQPKKLTAKQERVLNALLDEHSTMEGDCVIFNDGWSDRAIASEARKTAEYPELLTDGACANHRRQAYGLLHRENRRTVEAVTSRTRITQLQAEVNDLSDLLRAEVDALSARVAELEQKQLKLFASPAEPRRSNNSPTVR
jgi:hypothetical protein